MVHIKKTLDLNSSDAIYGIFPKIALFGFRDTIVYTYTTHFIHYYLEAAKLQKTPVIPPLRMQQKKVTQHSKRNLNEYLLKLW